MIKLLMIFTVLSPEGDVINNSVKDVSLTMTYSECVISAPSVAEIIQGYYGTIKYERVKVIAECKEG